jgi:hypothetical protein
MTLAPRIEGTLPIRSPASAFLQAFSQRAETGLLIGRPQPRSSYVVTATSDGGLRVRAAGWSTAIAVGLNDLELRPTHAGAVQYRLQYWQWTCYGVGLCGILGGIGLWLLLAFDARAYIASHPGSQFPGLSIEQNLRMAWAMALFWGFAWPWILVALHKRPLRRLLTRIVAEVDESVAGK